MQVKRKDKLVQRVYKLTLLHKSVLNYAKALFYPFVSICFDIFCI